MAGYDDRSPEHVKRAWVCHQRLLARAAGSGGGRHGESQRSAGGREPRRPREPLQGILEIGLDERAPPEH